MKARSLTKETVAYQGENNPKIPSFRVGDSVEVGVFVKEGEKERIQNFAGDVIALHRGGISSTFTVRRIGANNIGVERIFPYHSPIISSVKVLKRGLVRRSKLFYLRDRVGKAARIREKIVTKKQGAGKTKQVG